MFEVEMSNQGSCQPSMPCSLLPTSADGSSLPEWVTDNAGTLHFARVTRDDAGNYTCIASNEPQGQIRAHVQLTVAGNARSWRWQGLGVTAYVPMLPLLTTSQSSLVSFYAVFITFKVEPERTTVYQGHTALLRCEAQGDPKPLIQWKGKDRILDPTKLGPR